MPNNLIIACLKHDKKAERLLYEKYKRSWFMLCLRYARNKMEAEDFFQEGLLSVFNKMNQFDSDKGTFENWSNRVMVNACLQNLRKWKRIDNLTFSVDDQVQHYVENQAHSNLNTYELTKMIQKLPDGYRIIFNLYVLEGYKHKEIASLLNISENTSKSQLFKAKKMLRKELELLFQNDYQ